MADIERASLKNNFLKDIIFRLDFTGVIEPELFKVVESLKDQFKDKGFNRLIERYQDNVSLSFNLDTLQKEEAPNKSIQKIKIYSFLNEDKGIAIDISPIFACVNINSSSYTRFEDYGSLLFLVYETFSKLVNFFSVNRIGLRKINACALSNLDFLNNYFNEKLFSLYDSIDDVKNINSEKLSIFEKDQFLVRLGTFIHQGKILDKQIYQITIDTDVYLSDIQKIKNLLADYNNLVKMNELIFDIYISALTTSFINELQDDEFNDDKLQGINKNE